MKKFLLAFTFMAIAGTAMAVPGLVNYQGTLLDDNNIPVTQTNVPIVISIWDHPTSTAGTNRKYQENHTVNVDDGNFSFPIGSGSSPVGTFNANLFNTGSSLYLQLNISGEDLLPRVRFLSAPYTLQAENSGLLGNQPPAFYATASALAALQNQVNNLQIPSAKDICISTYGSVWVDSQSLCVGGSVDISKHDLSGEDLSGVRLFRARLDMTKLAGATIHRALLDEVVVTSAIDLAFADLKGSTLNGLNLEGVSLNDTDLTGVYTNNLSACPFKVPVNWDCLQTGDIPKVYRLIGPTARFSDDRDLPPAMWDGVNFPPKLQGVNFRNNIFHNCSFAADTNFTDANLAGARFASCEFSAQTTWSNTICPDGTNSDDATNDGSCFGNHGIPAPK